MQRYWLSKQMVHIFTARLKGLKKERGSNRVFENSAQREAS
jgi:hypothetical protein